jgi:hypothetical protein
VLKTCRNFVLEESTPFFARRTVAGLTKKTRDSPVLIEESRTIPGAAAAPAAKNSVDPMPLATSSDHSY